MAMLERSTQDPVVRSHPESRPHSENMAGCGDGGGGSGGGGGGGGVLRWLAARGGMLGGDAGDSDGSCPGFWRGGRSLGGGTGEAGLLALEHSWFASYVASAPWEVRTAPVVGRQSVGVGGRDHGVLGENVEHLLRLGWHPTIVCRASSCCGPACSTRTKRDQRGPRGWYYLGASSPRLCSFSLTPPTAALFHVSSAPTHSLHCMSLR